MSTLFQLHSDLEHLKSHIKQLNSLWQTGDGVLLMGQTIAFTDWVFAYVDTEMHEADYDQEPNADERKTEVQVQWYGLQADIDAFNATAKQCLQLDKERITLLSDVRWVTLTQEYDKVMTIST